MYKYNYKFSFLNLHVSELNFDFNFLYHINCFCNDLKRIFHKLHNSLIRLG